MQGCSVSLFRNPFHLGLSLEDTAATLSLSKHISCESPAQCSSSWFSITFPSWGLARPIESWPSCCVTWACILEGIKPAPGIGVIHRNINRNNQAIFQEGLSAITRLLLNDRFCSLQSQKKLHNLAWSCRPAVWERHGHVTMKKGALLYTENRSSNFLLDPCVSSKKSRTALLRSLIMLVIYTWRQ